MIYMAIGRPRQHGHRRGGGVLPADWRLLSLAEVPYAEGEPSTKGRPGWRVSALGVSRHQRVRRRRVIPRCWKTARPRGAAVDYATPEFGGAPPISSTGRSSGCVAGA